jgi:hypothetical protein
VLAVEQDPVGHEEVHAHQAVVVGDAKVGHLQRPILRLLVADPQAADARRQRRDDIAADGAADAGRGADVRRAEVDVGALGGGG